MEKVSATPAAQKEQPLQRPDLRVVEPDTKPEPQTKAETHFEDVEDMWDNMPV